MGFGVLTMIPIWGGGVMNSPWPGPSPNHLPFIVCCTLQNCPDGKRQ